MRSVLRRATFLLIAFMSVAATAQSAGTASGKPAKPVAKAAAKQGTPAQAEKFVQAAEKDLLDLGIKAGRTA